MNLRQVEDCDYPRLASDPHDATQSTRLSFVQRPSLSNSPVAAPPDNTPELMEFEDMTRTDVERVSVQALQDVMGR